MSTLHRKRVGTTRLSGADDVRGGRRFGVRGGLIHGAVLGVTYASVTSDDRESYEISEKSTANIGGAEQCKCHFSLSLSHMLASMGKHR